jgi:hypothetical protein
MQHESNWANSLHTQNLSISAREYQLLKQAQACVSVVLNLSRRKIAIALICRFPFPPANPSLKLADGLFYSLLLREGGWHRVPAVLAVLLVNIIFTLGGGGEVVGETLQMNATDIFLLGKFWTTETSRVGFL